MDQAGLFIVGFFKTLTQQDGDNFVYSWDLTISLTHLNQFKKKIVQFSVLLHQDIWPNGWQVTCMIDNEINMKNCIVNMKIEELCS